MEKITNKKQDKLDIFHQHVVSWSKVHIGINGFFFGYSKNESSSLNKHLKLIEV